MLHLSPRLKAVADFVRQGCVLADVGTDHAYVPVYLIKNGVIGKAFASDINEGPLENAKNTILQNEVQGIQLVLCSGLKKIEPFSVNDIVIAGMGGELISGILSQAEWCKDEKINLILQPMTREAELRKFLYQNGYEIKSEEIVAEKSKIYTVMLVSYSGNETEISESFALMGFPKCNSLFEEKKTREISRLKKVILQLENKENSAEEQGKLKKLVEELKGY